MNMREKPSILRFFAGAWTVRVAVGLGVLFLGGMGVSGAFAETAPSSPSMRVLELPAGGVAVEWAREPGPAQVLGWHVERQGADGEILRVTDERVEAELFSSPAQVVRFHDTSASARVGDGISYRLVTVDPEWRERPSLFVSSIVEADAPVSAPSASSFRALSTPSLSAMTSSGTGPRVRIGVNADGLYRLTAAEIAAVLSGSEPQVAQAIAQTNLALSCGGEAVAWQGEAGGAALRFFGQAYRNTYTDQNVYWLEAGPGLTMESIAGSTATVAVDPWFWETARVEQDLYFMPYLPGEEDDDYFVWSGQQLTSPATSWTWTSPVTLTDLHPAMKTGTVTADLISAYDGTPELDNHTRLSVPGQELADQQWVGDERLSQSGTATNLSGGSVSVSVELRRDSGVTTTTVLIDALEVRYARRMQALNNQLLFRPEPGTNTLTVRGFTSSAIQVWEVTDPIRPVEITATLAQEAASSWRASWSVEPASTQRFLAAATWRQPESIVGVPAAGWDGPMTGAPHLVIAPQAMLAAATALVTHRQGQGLDSVLVPIEDLYDAFAFGRRDPRAIPLFLAHAQTAWSVPPQYVCLAGDGHLDYYDHYNQSVTRPNHVPPLQERIPYDAGTSGTRVTLGLDNLLADTDADGFPDLAIGRLPAPTPAALTQMIDRIVAYEASDAWKNKALLMSDKDDEDIFALACARLADRVPPGMTLQELAHTSSTSASSMRSSFSQRMNSGPFLSVYFGHANNVGMSSPYFFEHSYIRSYMYMLTNSVRAPVFLAGTCMLNDFASPHPDNRCLGKGFMDTAPGGCVAVWAGAAEASLSMAETMTGSFFDELFENDSGRLGDLIRPALDIQAASASPWTVRTTVLLGDPGTRVRTFLFSDSTPPVVQIASPTTAAGYAALTNRVTLGGTASDLDEVTQVVIRNSRVGGDSMAVGTDHWRLSGVPVVEGTNWISAIAVDSSGNSSTGLLQVIYVANPLVPHGEITRVQTVPAGLELDWNSAMGHTYRIGVADSIFGPFAPMDPLILTLDDQGQIVLPIELDTRQIYFQILRVTEE
jgi:Peptidase family C25